MKKRPLSLKFVALFYLLIALSLPLQVALLFQHGFSEWAQIMSKMTLINWVLATLALLTASFIWMGHRYVKYFIPLTILVVILKQCQFF